MEGLKKPQTRSLQTRKKVSNEKKINQRKFQKLQVSILNNHLTLFKHFSKQTIVKQEAEADERPPKLNKIMKETNENSEAKYQRNFSGMHCARQTRKCQL